MLITAEVTKMAESIAAQLPILTNIGNSTEHEQALELMEELIDKYDSNLLLIEALGNAIARYEDASLDYQLFNLQQNNIDPAVATLKTLMIQHNLKSTDFEDMIGKKSMVFQVLAGKKRLTREHISRLANRFNISPALFF